MVGQQAATRKDYVSGDVPPGLYEAAEAWGIDPKAYRGRTADIRQAVIEAKRKFGPERGYDYTNMSDQPLVDSFPCTPFPTLMIPMSPDQCQILPTAPPPTDPQHCLFPPSFSYPPAHGIHDVQPPMH